MENSNAAIGIDFGTTNTAVVLLAKNGEDFKVQRLGDGNLPFPSLFSISEANKMSFGNAVKKRRGDEAFASTHTVVSSFKPLLGSNGRLTIYGKSYTPADIVKGYLMCIVKQVKASFGIDVNEAVLSYPVDFSPLARRRLCEAAAGAGIKVRGMVAESTAAYLAVKDKVKGFSNVLVMDWGGGTFDISALSVRNGRVTEKAVCGTSVGGDDIDRALAEHVHSKLNASTPPEERKSFDEMPEECKTKLMIWCENAKIAISESGEEYPLTLIKYGDYGTKNVTVTPEELDGIVIPIIKSKILAAIDRTLDRAEMTAAGVDKVIIAGGSSRLRQYQKAIANIFGEDKLYLDDNFQFISAAGAAVMPFVGDGFRLADNVGILMSDYSVYKLFEGGEDGIGAISPELTFSLVEDCPDAHFIITNSDGRVVYDRVSVPVKGFLRENVTVKAQVTDYQTIKLDFHSDAMADNLKDTVKEINRLTFYYDLNNI